VSPILDRSGQPFAENLTRQSVEVVIDEEGQPRRADGRSILEVRKHALDRADAFMDGPGLVSGFGYPGYRGATFRNGATGVGTTRDKTTWGNYWAPWRISDAELLAMMNGHGLAAKIIEEEPQEMFRNGWEVRSRDIDDDDIKVLEDKAAELRLNELLLDACVWGRCFGGALNILGAEDGKNPDEPLDEEAIKTFHYINVVDRRFIWVQRYYSDMLSPKYGLPEVYLVTNVVSHSGLLGTTAGPQPGQRLAAVSIHESRCIRFDGNRSDVLTRQQLAGWTWSVLQRVYDRLRRFDGSTGAVEALLSDASQAVFKLKNLMEMIAQNQKGELITRMQLVDFSRSTMRAVMLDADSEDFTRQTTSFAGIPDTMDRMMMLVAGDAGYPVTRLFGRSAAGMNATGESDERLWLSRVKTKQTNDLGPKIKRVYRLMAAAKDSGVVVKAKKTTSGASKGADFQIEFGQLYEPTDMEQADRELKVAQRDQIYLDEGVVTAEEVKLGRFGSGKFSSWVDVDPDELQKAIDGQVKFDPYANEPVPEGALASGGAAGQGEMQSPVVPLPLPGSPDLAGARAQVKAASPQRQPTPKNIKKDVARLDSNTIAAAVHHQLAADFPEKSIAWTLSADWKGPKRVSLDRLDFEQVDKWQASHDDVHVEVMKKRLESGIEKPVILVKTPHSKKLIVVDGHHRVLAYKALGKNVKAYIATVSATTGPWDEMHSQQKDGMLGSNQLQGT
jgi:uncharacterized protein